MKTFSKNSNDFYFLKGGGEMGELIRATDWSKTSLGDPKDWPQSLCTMVAVMLDNPFGMSIVWGKEYIALYNDGFRPILGSLMHPQALGRSTRETFGDKWNMVESMYAKVLKGEAVRLSDFMFPLNRNGFVEECYFDFSYSPIRIENGEVGGLLITVIETTERKKAIDALKESEERFRTMAEGSDILISVADDNLNTTYFNNAWAEFTGRPVEDLMNFGWKIFLHPDDLEIFMNTYQKAFEKKESFVGQIRVLNKEGEYRWLLAKIPTRLRQDGSHAGYVSSCVDITEQINALKKVEDKEHDLRNLVLHAPIGICVLDAPTLVSEIVNDSFIEVAGKPYEAIAGQYYWDTFAEAKPYYEAALRQVVEEGITYYANEVQLMLIRHGREETVYVTFVYAPLKNAEGKVEKVAIWVLENTQQVIARQKVEEAEEKATLAINSAELGVYEIIYATNEMHTDKRFKEIWGFDDSTSRDQYAASIHPDDLLLRNEAHHQSLASGQLDYQARIIWKDKSIHWVRVTGTILYDDKDQPSKLIGVAQDITASVNAQKKIEESERNIRNMVLQAPVAMCIFRGPSYQVEIANNKMIELWGKSEKEVMNKPIFEGLPEAKEQGLEHLLYNVYTTGERFVANERPVNLPRNGKIEKFYVNFVYEAMKSDDSISGILAVAIDVTQQVEARQKIEEIVAERTKDLANANHDLQKSNAELAQFAYIASHDLQEPLRKITTFAQMLENNLANKIDDSSKKYLDKINSSASRMNKLIRDVLTYSELVKENEIFTEVDLNKIIENIKTDYELLIEQHDATIHCSGLPVIEAIPLQMSQLFANLISNALKFIRKDLKPVITITASKADKSELENLSLDGTITYYKIQFTDNGIGIKPEYTAQIFNIFQRLHRKSEFEGTGIGLAMCKKIALNHQGELNATGSSEKGAVFNVFLPVKQNRE